MRTYKWLLLGGSIMFLAALVSLLFSPFNVSATSGPNCDPTYCSYVDTTVTDFAQGRFYATGLRNVGNDGAVQLLPVGLTTVWGSDYYTLPVARAEHSAVIYKDNIYVIGGYGAGGLISDVIAATTFVTGPIKSPGWVTISTAPGKGLARASMAAVISPTQSGGFIYVLGGDSTGTYAESNLVSFIQINANGQLVTDWKTTTPLTDAVSYPQAVVRNGYLYVMGGYSAGWFHADIYRAQISSIGTLSEWVQETNGLSPGRSSFGAATWQKSDGTDYLYVVGGETDGPSVTEEVDYGTFNSDTVNPLKATLPLPAPWAAHVVVQGNGQLFSTGGEKEGAGQPVTDVNVALIDTTDGSLYGGASAWVNSQPLLEARWGHASVINSGGEIYVIGGYGPPSGTNNTVYHGSTAGFGKFYATKGNYISAPMDLVQVRNLKQITLNSTITDSVHTTMTVQYRVGFSTQFTNTVWKTLGPLQSGIAHDTNYDVNETASFFQYQAFFTSTRLVTETLFSPSLNAVTVSYPKPATSTPTATTTGTVTTPTPTPTGVITPDLTIPDMGAPAAFPLSPFSKTVTVRVFNQGGKFNRPIPITSKPLMGQQSTPRGTKRTLPRGISATLGYTQTTNYFAYIDVYVDPDPVPTTVTQLGNCATIDSGTNWGWIYNLSAGQYADVPIECYLQPGVHQFYAQVDTCDDLTGTHCSTSYGYILESNENNNIFGSVPSGHELAPLVGNFLPVIRKN